MATRIHPKNVHEKSPKNVHEMSPKKRTFRGQKCPRNVIKSVHEISATLTRGGRLLLAHPALSSFQRPCTACFKVYPKSRFLRSIRWHSFLIRFLTGQVTWPTYTHSLSKYLSWSLTVSWKTPLERHSMPKYYPVQLWPWRFISLLKLIKFEYFFVLEIFN